MSKKPVGCGVVLSLLPAYLFPPFKEPRRSARGRFFHESPQGHKWELVALREFQELPTYGDVRNDTEKPRSPPPSGKELGRPGQPPGFEVLPLIADS